MRLHFCLWPFLGKFLQATKKKLEYKLFFNFSMITCMMRDQVRSKPWLGLLGCVSAVMAILAAFGFAMYIGIDFIGINLASPLLMISK